MSYHGFPDNICPLAADFFQAHRFFLPQEDVDCCGDVRKKRIEYVSMNKRWFLLILRETQLKSQINPNKGRSSCLKTRERHFTTEETTNNDTRKTQQTGEVNIQAMHQTIQRKFLIFLVFIVKKTVTIGGHGSSGVSGTKLWVISHYHFFFC